MVDNQSFLTKEIYLWASLYALELCGKTLSIDMNMLRGVLLYRADGVFGFGALILFLF
jgi:hypothetical protein